MSVKERHLGDDGAVAAEAVEWFLRVEQPDVPLDVLAAWQQWLERSREHRDAYEVTQRTWQALNEVSPLPWPTDSEVDSDHYVGSTSVQRWIEMRSSQRARGWRISWRQLRWAAAACMVVVVGSLSVVALRFSARDTPATFAAHVATRTAEHRDVSLPDGSHISVGAQSSIEINISNKERQVRLLSGEAFFRVAKDAQRPFVVEAGLGRVTAVGTAFNVRRYRTVVAVEVAEGEVRFEGNAAAAEHGESLPASTALRSGQEAVLDNRGALQAIRRSAEDVAAWRAGRHHYVDEPLSVVIADLNRYATQRIVVDDPEIGALRITATFFSDDWRGWLETLEAAAPALHVRTEADAIHIDSGGSFPSESGRAR